MPSDQKPLTPNPNATEEFKREWAKEQGQTAPSESEELLTLEQIWKILLNGQLMRYREDEPLLKRIVFQLQNELAQLSTTREQLGKLLNAVNPVGFDFDSPTEQVVTEAAQTISTTREQLADTQRLAVRWREKYDCAACQIVEVMAERDELRSQNAAVREIMGELAARLKKSHDDDPDCKACKSAKHTGIQCPDITALAKAKAAGIAPLDRATKSKSV